MLCMLLIAVAQRTSGYGSDLLWSDVRRRCGRCKAENVTEETNRRCWCSLRRRNGRTIAEQPIQPAAQQIQPG